MGQSGKKSYAVTKSPRLKQILVGRKITGNGAFVDPQEIARSNFYSADPSGSAVYGRLVAGSLIRIPLGAWMFVSCVYVVLSCVGRGLCDGLTDRLNSHFIRQFSYSFQRCLC
jgi:hypothetical protein